MIPKELTAKLTKFLSEHCETEGYGWAPVTHNDIAHLHQLMDAIVDAKWDADCDGDRPINFQIVDRTRFEPMHFTQVPYRHHADGFVNPLAREAWNAQVLEACMRNMKTATDMFDTEVHIEQHHRLERARKHATFQDGDKIVCVVENEDHLTIGHVYEAEHYSWWREDVEMVRVKLDDGDERWNSYPVSCFKKENQE